MSLIAQRGTGSYFEGYSDFEFQHSADLGNLGIREPAGAEDVAVIVYQAFVPTVIDRIQWQCDRIASGVAAGSGVTLQFGILPVGTTVDEFLEDVNGSGTTYNLGAAQNLRSTAGVLNEVDLSAITEENRLLAKGERLVALGVNLATTEITRPGAGSASAAGSPSDAGIEVGLEGLSCAFLGRTDRS